MSDDDSRITTGLRELLEWFIETDNQAILFIRDVASGVLLVVLISILIFGVSGVWPPLVAVESGSMEPHMYRGDLVFVMEEHRLTPDEATGPTGVVTYRTGVSHETHRKFGAYGDVIVFDSNGDGGIPIIHRAHFWVDAGENWYDNANPEYLDGESCMAISNCPAPHAGFITKGDNNPRYDQVEERSTPVQPTWIRGTAEVRVPLLGHVRLAFSD